MDNYRYKHLTVTLNDGTKLSVSYYTKNFTIYDVVKEIIKEGFVRIDGKFYPMHNVYSIEEE